MSRPPLPPFTRETAAQKARMAEDAWNSRDPERVALAYTEDSRWRNRSEFFEGRAAIVTFLTRKWEKEKDYRLIKDLLGPASTISRSPKTTVASTGPHRARGRRMFRDLVRARFKGTLERRSSNRSSRP